MPTDLTLFRDDQPGELGRVSGALGAAGVNIAGFCAVTSGGGQGEVHVLGDVCRRLGENGVNITLAYLATATRLVLAADDFAAAKAALK